MRRTLRADWKGLVAELRRLGPQTSLASYLEEAGLELPDLYRPGRGGWSSLRRLAGFDDRPPGSHDEVLGRTMTRLLHVDDPERLAHLRSLFSDADPSRGDFRSQRLGDMLRVAVLDGSRDAAPPDVVLQALRADIARVEELAALTSLLDDRIHRVTRPVDPGGAVPLHVHARYRRGEALAAFGDARHMREGVRWLEAAGADLFFVTLRKSEDHFSPTTMYADRAITPDLFQWESQSTLSERAPTAQRYIHHAERGSTVHLFLRETSTSDGALGRDPFFYAGKMSYVEHRGERPVRFTWRLDTPLPADVFHLARASAA